LALSLVALDATRANANASGTLLFLFPNRGRTRERESERARERGEGEGEEHVALFNMARMANVAERERRFSFLGILIYRGY
jgi:hypothetical protein